MLFCKSNDDSNRYFFTLAHPRCHEHGHAVRSSPQLGKQTFAFGIEGLVPASLHKVHSLQGERFQGEGKHGKHDVNMC